MDELSLLGQSHDCVGPSLILTIFSLSFLFSFHHKGCSNVKEVELAGSQGSPGLCRYGSLCDQSFYLGGVLGAACRPQGDHVHIESQLLKLMKLFLLVVAAH